MTVFVYTLARSCEEGEEVLRCWERVELSSDWLEEGVEVGATRCHTLHSLLLLPGYIYIGEVHVLKYQVQ